ncbi:hypothetical protein KPL40_09490 [Clostridium gasigenes]|nr:hypothetical protein [Clostridium gasigenes]
MKKMKDLLGNTMAVIYFIFPMCFVLLMLVFMPISFFTSVSSVRNSGFAGQNMGGALIGICGLFIGGSLLIPPLRKMYKKLPWLYSLIKIFYVNLIILSVGLIILNMGYQVKDDARHAKFFILMIVQIVVCRIAMCIYFNLKPVKYIEER